MDYKTTSLDKFLECKEQIYPEFPNLFFGKINDKQLVFDATAYCAQGDLKEIENHTFQTLNKRYIQSLVTTGMAQGDKLFYLNRDGHILMDRSLAFLFMAFVDENMFSYFNSLLQELIVNGIALSDSFVFTMASEKIPSEILLQIIKERENATKA